jgi:hypothetical protein
MQRICNAVPRAPAAVPTVKRFGAGGAHLVVPRALLGKRVLVEPATQTALVAVSRHPGAPSLRTDGSQKTSYFENERGGQSILVAQPGDEHATLYHGPTNWSEHRVDRDGTTADVTRAERQWLNACLAAWSLAEAAA